MQPVESLRRSLAPEPVRQDVSLVPKGDHPDAHSWLVQLLRRHSPMIGSVLIYAMGVGLLTLVTPIAVQALVSNVTFGTLLQPLFVLSLLLLAGLALRGVLKVLQAWVVEALQRRLFIDFVEQLAARLPRLSPQLLRTRHGPELANRFFDVFLLQKATASLLVGGLDAVLTAFVGMCVLAFYHPLLLAFDLLLVLSLASWIWLLGRGGVGSAVEESRAKYAMADVLEQSLGHPISARSRPGREAVVRLIDARAHDYLVARARHFNVVLRQLIGAMVLQAVASAGLLGVGGWLVISRELTVGQLVAAELIVTGVVAAFSVFGKHAETFYDLLASIDKLASLVGSETEDPRGEFPPEPVGSASCELVGVALYDGAEPLSVNLPAGARVRLRGGSDRRREQLLRCLYRLESPHAGYVRLDDVDVRDLALDALRARVALVVGPEIWSGSVLDNLKLEAPDVDPIAVRRALQALALSDELSALPSALSTALTPAGGPLSFGQALRVTLARAYLRKPQLLLVGNAIDVLAPDLRRGVVKALADSDHPWTLLLASHDAALDDCCTHVLDLDTGKLETTR